MEILNKKQLLQMLQCTYSHDLEKQLVGGDEYGNSDYYRGAIETVEALINLINDGNLDAVEELNNSMEQGNYYN
jgi:hypothetical protein